MELLANVAKELSLKFVEDKMRCEGQRLGNIKKDTDTMSSGNRRIIYL